MEFAVLVAGIAAVLIVMSITVPNAVRDMHKHALNDRKEQRELQERRDAADHKRYLEMLDAQQEPSELELEARKAQAEADRATALTERDRFLRGNRRY